MRAGKNLPRPDGHFSSGEDGRQEQIENIHAIPARSALSAAEQPLRPPSLSRVSIAPAGRNCNRGLRASTGTSDGRRGARSAWESRRGIVLARQSRRSGAAEIASAWARTRTWNGLSPGEAEKVRSAFVLAQAMLDGRHGGMDYRTFSRRVSGDSKMLERLEGPVVRLLGASWIFRRTRSRARPCGRSDSKNS